jgi:ABC-2 type transport system ATP-binding protein
VLATLTAQKLRKEFNGFAAIKDISFAAVQGEVVGFLGPNGAGKSTTMKILAGFLTPTSGSAHICGLNIIENPIRVKNMLGYLAEGSPLYTDMTVENFLSFIGKVRGFSGKSLSSKVLEVLDKVNLSDVRKQLIDTLSKGYKRRVGLAQALIHDPKILLLDEPTDGLDPNQKYEVRKLISEMAKDKIIILSTHILEEVEYVCDRAIVVANGEIMIDSTPSDLIQRSPLHNTVVFTVKNVAREKVSTTLGGANYISNLEWLDSGMENHVSLRVHPKSGYNTFDAISAVIAKEGWDLRDIHTRRGQLDEVFRQITKGTNI